MRHAAVQAQLRAIAHAHPLQAQELEYETKL